MPDFRVDSIYDLTAIEEEQAKFLAFLAQSKASLLDLNKQRIDLKGSDISSFTQASQNLNKTITDSNKAIQNVTVTSTEYNKQLALSTKAAKDAAQAKLLEAKAILEQEKADAVRTKSLIAQEKELDRLIKLEEKKNATAASAPSPVIDGGTRNATISQNPTDDQVAAFEKLRDAEAQASMGAAEYGNSVNIGIGNTRKATAADLELAKARAAVSKANSTQNVELQGLSVQRALANKAAKEEALTNLGLIDSYTLLNKEYQAAAINAKNIAVEYGIESVEAKAAAAEALALNTQIQAIDKTVGQSQKNVGNYGSAFTKGLSSIWGGLRKIAYIIPGLGIAGLISAMIDPLINLYKWLTKSDGAIFSLTDKINLFNTVMKSADENAGKEVADLKILYSATQDVTLSTKERLNAAKKLQDLWPDTFKNMSEEKILLGDAKAGYDELSVSILKNAQARAAADEIEKLEGQKLDALNQKLKIQNATANEAAANRKKMLSGEGEGGTGAAGLAKSLVNANALQKESENIQERKNKKLKEQDSIITGINAKEKFLIDLVGAGNLADSIPDPTKGKKGASSGSGPGSLSELKDSLNTEFDIWKIHQEAKIRLFQDETKSEEVYYLDKLQALDDYLKAEKELLDREEQNQIELAQKAAAREVQHLQESKVGKSAPEKSRIDQNILITQQNLEQQILLIKAKYADEGNKVIEGAADTRNKIIEDHLKIEEELYKQIADSEQKNIDDDNARIQKGFEERYKLEQEFAQKKAELLKQLHQQEIELGTQASNFLYALATAGYENQLNQITDQGKEITKRKDEELAANDAIVQSADQKAANVILINAKAQAQQDALDRKTAAIKNKEAQFQRAQQIFEIGINTIKTIAAIKLQIVEATIKAIANPIFAPLVGLIAAQIPVALASSALSIGTLLATPLPHYKHGRGEKGEELAVVGDGGVNEFIWRHDGRIEKTPAVNTLTHLMPKDKVYPNKEALMKELILNSMQLSNYSVSSDGGINRNDLEKLGTRLENAVSGITFSHTTVTKAGWRTQNERLAKYDNWVNRAIKN